MKTLFIFMTLSLLAPFTSIAGPIINNNDVMTATSLQYDVDGIEMWTIASTQREDAYAKFEQKCNTEIPQKFADRLNVLGANVEDFQYSTKIISKTYRRIGTQYICRSTMQLTSYSKYVFKFNYSAIFSEQPYETCKKMVADLDTQVESLSLFDRRAYLELGFDQNHQTIYTKCQVLSIILNDRS